MASTFLLAVAQTPPPSAAEFPEGERLTITQTLVTYDVTGSTPAALRADMNAKQPTDKFGVRYDATTRWQVSLSLRPKQSAEGCQIDVAFVKIAITSTAPRLVGALPPALQAQFDRYLDALMMHENGHADTGRMVGREIADALPALKPEPSCDALQVVARATTDQIVAKGKKRDTDYDAETDHGKTQGARFP